MSVILPYDALRRQLPQAGVVVGAGGDEVGRVGREGAVPDPALVAGEGGLERVGVGRDLVELARFEIADLPDLGRVVGRAGRELLDVRREEDAGDILLVGVELGNG